MYACGLTDTMGGCVDVHDMSWDSRSFGCSLSAGYHACYCARGLCSAEEQAQAARCLPSADNVHRSSSSVRNLLGSDAAPFAICWTVMLLRGCTGFVTPCRPHPQSRTGMQCTHTSVLLRHVLRYLRLYVRGHHSEKTAFLHAGVYSMSGETRYNGRWLARSEPTYCTLMPAGNCSWLLLSTVVLLPLPAVAA
jgi:hypothetical protein